MNYRTTPHSLTFTDPFTVHGIDAVQPAGTYLVEMDEEEIEGLSFIAYRRVATRLRLATDPSHPGVTEFVEINCAEITAALDAPADPDR
jgi:hypothetical protein